MIEESWKATGSGERGETCRERQMDSAAFHILTDGSGKWEDPQEMNLPTPVTG